MYVVERLIDGNSTGKYFKKGNIRSRWDSKLVDKDEATVFRSMSGVKNCLGQFDFTGQKRGRARRILDETKWKAHEVSFHDVIR